MGDYTSSGADRFQNPQVRPIFLHRPEIQSRRHFYPIELYVDDRFLLGLKTERARTDQAEADETFFNDKDGRRVVSARSCRYPWRRGRDGSHQSGKLYQAPIGAI